MRTKYKVGDVVSIDRKEYQLVTTIEYIRIYPEYVLYRVNGIGMDITSDDISGKVESDGHIIF